MTNCVDCLHNMQVVYNFKEVHTNYTSLKFMSRIVYPCPHTVSGAYGLRSQLRHVPFPLFL